MAERQRGPFDSSFEAGHVPMDEPPGIEEAEYRRWKEAGGKVATPAETPPTWAIVHLMGHARYAGRLSEEEKFGVKLGRVDVPQQDGSFVTVYFGGGSVYKIEVVSEAAARIASRIHVPQPVSPWDFPKQLPAAEATLEPDYSRIAEDDDGPDVDSDLDL